MKTLAIVKYGFTLIGIGMLLGAFSLYKNTTSFLEEAARAEGTVVDLVRSRSSSSSSDSSPTYKPEVTFVTETGETVQFVSSMGSNPPSYSIGEQVTVFYLPHRPQEAQLNGYFSLWGVATIFAGLGSVFALVGGGLIVFPVLKRRKDQLLRKDGTPIDTQFQGVEPNRSISVNGRHPFRVITQWQNPTTSEIHLFQSNNLWWDPTHHIDRESITVFIEKNNPKKYFADLSFLPKMAK